MRSLPFPSWLLALSLLLVAPAAPGDGPGVTARAQAVPAALAGLPPEAATAWAEPLTDALHRAVAAGFFTDARGGGPLSLSVRVSRSGLDAGDGSFAVVLPESVAFDGATWRDPYVILSDRGRTPHVAGEGAGVVLVPRPGSPFEAALETAGRDPGEVRIAYPAGLGLEATETATLDVTLGIGGRITLVGRAAPTVELDADVGDVSAFGVGGLLSLAGWLPLPGVDLALTGSLQRVAAGGWLHGSSTTWGMLLSRRWGPVGARVHGSLTSTETEVRYRARNPLGVPGLPGDGTAVTASTSAGPEGRLLVGGDVVLGGAVIGADVTLGSAPLVGLSVGLRRP